MKTERLSRYQREQIAREAGKARQAGRKGQE